MNRIVVIALAGGLLSGCAAQPKFVPVAIKDQMPAPPAECNASIKPFPTVEFRDYSKVDPKERFREFSSDRVRDWRRAKSSFWTNASNQKICRDWIRAVEANWT